MIPIKTKNNTILVRSQSCVIDGSSRDDENSKDDGNTNYYKIDKNKLLEERGDGIFIGSSTTSISSLLMNDNNNIFGGGENDDMTMNIVPTEECCLDTKQIHKKSQSPCQT